MLIKIVLRQVQILGIGIRPTFMKGFDPLQMLTSILDTFGHPLC